MSESSSSRLSLYHWTNPRLRFLTEINSEDPVSVPRRFHDAVSSVSLSVVKDGDEVKRQSRQNGS